MMNPTKFVSLHLDTPSSRYEFLKFATKSRIINKENRISNRAQLLGAPGRVHPLWLIAGARRSMIPPVSDTRSEDGADRWKAHRRWGLWENPRHHRVPLVNPHPGVPLVGLVAHQSKLTDEHEGWQWSCDGAPAIFGEDDPTSTVT